MPGDAGVLRPRNGSFPARLPNADFASSLGSARQEAFGEGDSAPSGSYRRRIEGSPSRRSFSSSVTQKTPFRSYFHRNYHDCAATNDQVEQASESVREDTAELASRALSDCSRSGRSPNIESEAVFANPSQPKSANAQEEAIASSLTKSPRPSPIEELPEPLSAVQRPSASRAHSRSALTDLIQRSPSDDATDNADVEANTIDVLEAVDDHGASHSTDETTSLLSKPAEQNTGWKKWQYGTVADDLESTKSGSVRPPTDRRASSVRQFRAGPMHSMRVFLRKTSWRPAKGASGWLFKGLGYIPPVILGLLLNILDALSYGMILFPITEPLFADLGPDGISMFYVSCIASQLVYSLGGSIFKGGIGSEMIEVVPFFHKMAFMIQRQVGEEKPKAVLATIIISYSISSILTGVVFFLMGQCKIGTLIGFFPRHILLGCIGGVGLFLVQTGLEVSARLDGSFEYTIPTFVELGKPEKLPLWIVPLALATLLLVIKRYVKHPLTDAAFFISIIVIFYFFELVIPQLSMPELRSKGWVFEAPRAGVPFYHFYTLYDFGAVDWKALASTIPAMLALTFFGILHVPINIPALGVTTGEDNVDVDRELRAHGISNVLSGCCGSIQNYLVYTNTVLFMRSGGESRVAGVMLAIATAGVLVSGTAIIGFIPVMVVGSLIFFLGIDLMREALVDTWRRVHRLEYLTIVIIVITMGGWDFVIGILIGILLACVSFVLQASQISAIRSKLYGGVANSTVRRHPIQQRFLHDAGKQVCVMKLAGYLFFGTIVDVEKQIRALLDEAFLIQPIRFLVLDLFNVDGVDFSAAEAFTRLNRILTAKQVQLVVCGMSWDGDVGQSLRVVGLFDEEDAVQYFASLNSALEYCENQLLKALYHERDSHHEIEASPAFLEVPESKAAAAGSRRRSSSSSLASIAPPLVNGLSLASPRQSHLHRVATMTLSEQDPVPTARWSKYGQPLHLLLQTFSSVSSEPEHFWEPAATYFTRRTFAADSTVFSADDPPDGFYLLESGMLRARYDLPQGQYSEIIVAGTTCGELPFFAGTKRTATTTAERDSVAWMLDQPAWERMRRDDPAVAQEMLHVGLKLTSERMEAVTRYMLLISG